MPTWIKIQNLVKYLEIIKNPFKRHFKPNK